MSPADSNHAQTHFTLSHSPECVEICSQKDAREFSPLQAVLVRSTCVTSGVCSNTLMSPSGQKQMNSSAQRRATEGPGKVLTSAESSAKKDFLQRQSALQHLQIACGALAETFFSQHWPVQAGCVTDLTGTPGVLQVDFL